jgi:insulysin
VTDTRRYRVVKLTNQLEVLLVHDADTDKASAAMDVNVGNFSDPEDLPGLAHCVEHMLFMGTKKVRHLLRCEGQSTMRTGNS